VLLRSHTANNTCVNPYIAAAEANAAAEDEVDLSHSKKEEEGTDHQDEDSAPPPATPLPQKQQQHEHKKEGIDKESEEVSCLKVLGNVSSSITTSTSVSTTRSIAPSSPSSTTKKTSTMIVSSPPFSDAASDDAHLQQRFILSPTPSRSRNQLDCLSGGNGDVIYEEESDGDEFYEKQEGESDSQEVAEEGAQAAVSENDDCDDSFSCDTNYTGSSHSNENTDDEVSNASEDLHVSERIDEGCISRNEEIEKELEILKQDCRTATSAKLEDFRGEKEQFLCQRIRAQKRQALLAGARSLQQKLLPPPVSPIMGGCSTNEAEPTSTTKEAQKEDKSTRKKNTFCRRTRPFSPPATSKNQLKIRPWEVVQMECEYTLIFPPPSGGQQDVLASSEGREEDGSHRKRKKRRKKRIHTAKWIPTEEVCDCDMEQPAEIIVEFSPEEDEEEGFYSPKKKKRKKRKRSFHSSSSEGEEKRKKKRRKTTAEKRTLPFSGQKNHNYFGAIMFRSGLG